MLIHYLQRVEPPVLPNFQDVDEFGLKKKLINDNEVQFAENVSEDYRLSFLKNFMSLGELFVGFFDYFGRFDWYNEVLQIRTSQYIHKMDKGWFRLPISIEDPFLLTHNLTASIRNTSESAFLFSLYFFR
jgi:terminal uridylyltransferase